MRVVNNIESKYELHNLVTDALEDHHISKLKAFNFDPVITDPQLLANKDQQLFNVESIIEMRGNPRKGKKQLYFLVRWQGLDSTFDSWLPWNDLRVSSALYKFLSDNKLKFLIPKEKRATLKVLHP